MNSKNIVLPTNRKFGFFFTGVFLLLGVYLIHEALVNYSYILFSISASLFFITLLKPDTLLPLNKLWMRLGLLLSLIISPIVLGVIFFGLFTPVGLLLRLFGRDELKLKLDPSKSKWKSRDGDTLKSETFRNQF